MPFPGLPVCTVADVCVSSMLELYLQNAKLIFTFLSYVSVKAPVIVCDVGDSCSGWKEFNSLTWGPLASLLTSASNISGFGMSQKVGHLDFYPNGGKQMPGCQKNIISTIVDINGLWEGM